MTAPASPLEQLRERLRTTPLPVALLALAAFLAPVVGGHVPLESIPLGGPLLTELFGGGSLPLGTRLLHTTLVAAALAISLYQNRVHQIPKVRLLAAILVLLLSLGVTLAFTDFPYVSAREWLAWFVYAVAFVATVSLVGRGRHRAAVATALALGCAFAAVRGIAEFASIMATEPTYRIFAGWNNPNAAATVFVFGTLLLMGLAAAAQNRRATVLLLTGAALNVAALALTQSRGGFIALAVGLLAFLLLALVNRAPLRRTATALTPVLVGAIIAIGLGAAATAASAGGQAFARVADASMTQEQSVGFRANLWRSAAHLAREFPTGTGVGTFRFYSTKPGLVDQTVYAHQAYLQLASEGGWLALAAFAALGATWLIYVLRGSRAQPQPDLLAKAGIVAAVVGLGAHGIVESNLSYFGAGLAFFILAGLAVQYATDASSPENLPYNTRLGLALALGVVPIIAAALFAAPEANKANFLAALHNQDRQALQNAAPALLAGNYGDPDSLYLWALYAAPDPETSAQTLAKVAERHPTPRVLRAAARAALQIGKTDLALQLNQRVFRLDPNNLRAWALRLQILKDSGRHDEAIQTARQMLQVEATPAFKIRAIPEAVPTETLHARLYLASQTQNPQQKTTLLQEALDGFSRYARITIPQIQRMAKGGVPDFAGESLADAQANMDAARAAAKTLKNLYLSSGDSSSAAKVTETLGLLPSSLSPD